MPEDCFSDGQLLQNWRMCLSTFTPSLSRVRHWSCPDRLPSAFLHEEDLFLTQSKEAEDCLIFSQNQSKPRVLASWEEKVLSNRESRKRKHRLHLEKIIIDESSPIKDSEDSIVTARVEPCNTDPSILDIHSEQSCKADSSHSCDPFKVSAVHQTNDPSRLDLLSTHVISEKLPAPLKEKSYPETEHPPFLASSNQYDLDDSSQLANRLNCGHTLVIQNRHTIDLQISLQNSNQLLSIENSKLATAETNPNFSPHNIENLEAFCQKFIPESESVDSLTLTQEVLCPTESYLTSSYSFSWLVLMLPILIHLCSPKLKKKPKPGSHSRPSKHRKVLGIVPHVAKYSWIFGFAVFLISPVTSLSIIDHGDDFGDEILCTDGVYRGNIDINNRDETTKMSSLKRYENCSVVEGSISITSALYSAGDSVMNYSMPNLTEVTDFVLLFRADEIISLETIFPKLAVIRGHKLVQFYALAIYQMKNMETVGLPSLTHIMNGGVRIEKNPNLCYVNTIDWAKIVVQENDKKSHIEIADNQESNKCLDKCPSKCEQSCWNLEQCQRVLVPCPFGTEYAHQELCYTDDKGEVGRPCSRECVGGCRDRDQAMNNPEMCVACNHTRHYNEQGDSNPFMCREKCPSPFVAYKSWTCITKQECSSRQVSGFTLSNMLADSEEAESFYKVYDGQCVEKCPAGYEPKKKADNIWSCAVCKKDCPVNCDGEIINSRESALKLKSCTHIKGDIVINVISGDITPVLEETLRDIKEISGSLKIERSHSLVSLHFFKSLKKIGGEGSQKSLTIFENDNLQKLFADDKKITLGGDKVVFIHYNQKLCMKEINQFLDQSDVEMREEHSVSSVSNGNKIVCSEEKLDLKVITGGPDLLRLEYQNYIQTLEIQNQNTINIEALLGYHIYYRELSEEQFQNKGVSKYEGMDVCGGSTWNILFEDDPAKFTVFDNLSTNETASCNDKTEKCLRLPEEGKLIGKFKYNPVVTYIPNCKPYTPYAIYVTTVMEKQLAGKATGAQSEIAYARTNESNPSPVINVKAESPSPNSLDISWSRPVKPHGVIEQYYVEISYLGTGKDVEERDYCEKKKDKPEQPKIEPDPVNPTENDLGTCPTCESCGKDDGKDASKTAPDSNKVVGEMAFYNEIINKLFHIQTTTAAVVEDEMTMFDPLSKRKRRSVDSAASKNSLNDSSESQVKENHTFVYIQYQRNGPIKPISVENITMRVSDRSIDPYAKRVFVAIPGNQTSLTVNKLKHYSDYEVRVFACQKEQAGEKNKVYRVCSDESILNTKTTFDINADTINPWNDDEEIATQVGNSSEVTFIRWLPPQNPNERIVNYVLAWSKDTSQSKPYVQCISLSEINEVNVTHRGVQKTMMEYKLVTEGEYYIRLRAVSLFDEGKWTRWQFVKVNSNRSGIILTVVLLFFGVLITLMAATGGYVYYKRKKEPNGGIWNVSSRNPEYIDTAEVYVVDDWEVERKTIQKLEELGKGSFGLVYRGLFSHPTNGDMPCAIKTVNEKSSYRQRIEFLHEASAMKDFKTEHVIKLIGVVSQGQPALVLMELMENGDLKNFLRSLRPDSENNRHRLPVPTLRQVMQMAIEIADGMAYLSVKKVVHRDLAARNCMVSGDIVVKVGDFGMARDVYETEYYRKEGRGLLPVRWMAPESIKDGKFTSQSDVWSYGVVLWEMATLAEQPYQGFTNDEVMKYVKDGNKMRRPEDCPDILYNLMSECWNNSPNDRPTFLEICQRLLPEANDNFHNVSFFMSPDGREAVINQEAMFQLRREQEEANSMDPATPLTIGHNGNGLSPENGHLPRSGESHPMVNLRPGSRSPTHVQFSNESGSRSSKLSMNGIVGIAQRFRNKSGSTSGEA